eukprot:scaffold1784_cov116-Cylindrotheca_fusiformis.AAC.15
MSTGDEEKTEAIGAESTKALVEEKNDSPDGEVGEVNETKQQLVEEEIIAQSMSLDVAYTSLETIRQVNLQVEFGRSLEPSECIPCLREAKDKPQIQKNRFRTWVSERTASKAAACLTCGAHVCKSHRSPAFSKQNIPVCLECAHLFSIDYMMKHIIHAEDDSPDVRRKKMNNMLEVYDRALLVLTYSIQFVDEVAVALEENTTRHNRVGLGSSATGVVSGGLGVAAAVTIFTPVGPPLLLASILFGSGAAAADAASEAVNYRCEPNKMADRIITLHSIINSREESTCAALEKNSYERLEAAHRWSSIRRIYLDGSPRNEKYRSVSGVRTNHEVQLIIIRSCLTQSELPFLTETVDKIRAGNPCDKAEQLKVIKQEASMLPKTEDLSVQIGSAIKRQQEITKTAKDQLPQDPEQAVAATS